ncbi:hypothetical protein [Microvirga yunnanensis]|uniref:hypothetical protein n=1 Tax=Microvirga yunnanensis TaxID=2953740 RepID=UPI0021C8F4ED|nr:hypothetical protein [Microvirga sp. HBU65207]
MNRLYTLASVAFCVTAASGYDKPTKDIPTGGPEYIAKAMMAAPQDVGKKSTIARINEKFEPTEVLQKGTNGFTCGIEPSGVPFCADEGGMAWYRAIYNDADPPAQAGFIYMLTGDQGTSNHQPGAKDHSHWVETGPHIMITGKAVQEMAASASYQNVVDADPTQPFVMFPGNKYQHLMIPMDMSSAHSHAAAATDTSMSPKK